MAGVKRIADSRHQPAFVRCTQATDIGGHPSAILEKSKSTDRSLKNDGPDPLLEVDQNTIYVCILMAKPT
jgi:hypothetical protein